MLFVWDYSKNCIGLSDKMDEFPFDDKSTLTDQAFPNAYYSSNLNNFLFAKYFLICKYLKLALISYTFK